MNGPTRPANGGFHFGNIGGSVTMSAGGDIVGGDKTSSSSAKVGFGGEDQKRQFQAQIDILRETLRSMKTSIEAHKSLSADETEAMVTEILRHVSALKTVKEQAASVAPGVTVAPAVVHTVESTLEQAGNIVGKLQAFAEKAGTVGEAIGTAAAKYGPLLESARRLFGLP